MDLFYFSVENSSPDTMYLTIFVVHESIQQFRRSPPTFPKLKVSARPGAAQWKKQKEDILRWKTTFHLGTSFWSMTIGVLNVASKRLRHPRLNKYWRFRRCPHSQEIEGDIRVVMDRIRLGTEAHMGRLARDGGTRRIAARPHPRATSRPSRSEENCRL